MSMIRLALPKGSLQTSTIELFKDAGWIIGTSSRSYFPTIDDPDIECALVRAQEVSRYTTGLQFDLALTGNPQPRLPVGADLDVTYRVSLVEQPGRAIMDEQMMVHAWLADENGRLISDLSVTPDLDAQLYRAHFAGEPWLEGTYYVEVEANAAWLSAPLRDDPLPVIWGRVPRFDGPPQAVASTPIRIENPFTVTAALLNVDTVSAPLLVRLQVVEQASGGTVYSQRNECDETCTFVIPALQTEGAYTVTATLYEGRTAQNVVYSPGQQERAYTVVEVGPLVFPQLWLRFMRLNWPLMLGAVVAFLFALMLLWRFGYRARIVAVRDFDTLRSRL